MGRGDEDKRPFPGLVKRKAKSAKIDKEIKESPFESSRKIAKKLNVSPNTVAKRRKQTTMVVTKEAIKLGVIDFLKRFTDAEKYFEKKEIELEALKSETKVIFKKNSTGQSYPETVSLDPMDKLRIIQEQRQNQLDLLFMVSKPKVILGLQQVENAPQLE